MAIITPGTGGTITASTAEGQLQAIVSWIAGRQASSQTNPNQLTNVFGAHDQQAQTFAGSYNLPVTLEIGDGGVIELSADPYLVGHFFQPGTGGTFESASPEGYLLEVLMYLQGLELVSENNPNNRNFITGTYNSDSGRYQGSFTLPCTFAVDLQTGGVIYTAEPYLT